MVSSGNKENDLMMASALPLVSDLDKLGDRMEVYYKARFTCIEGAMKTLSAGVAPSSTVKNQRLKIANQQPKPSWTSQFNQVSPVTRKLIKRSDDTILKVSLGGGSGTWHLIIEVAETLQPTMPKPWATTHSTSWNTSSPSSDLPILRLRFNATEPRGIPRHMFQRSGGESSGRVTAEFNGSR